MTDSEGLKRTWRSWAIPAFLALVAVAVQGMWASSREAQTWDEAAAIAAGYLQVADGDYGLMPENPPLLGLLVYVPFRLAGARLPDLNAEQRQRISANPYGQLFLYRTGNDHRRLMLLARAMVLLLTLAAVTTIVYWAFRLWGSKGAVLAALLCAFEPNWLAHGHLAAYDGIATSTLTLATAAVTAFLLRPTYPRSLLAGALTGMAWTAKHTTLLLWPALGLLFLLSLPQAGRWRLKPESPSGVLPARRLSVLWLLMVGTALVCVGAAYNLGWRYDIYFKGMGGIYQFAGSEYQSYLWGRFQQGGFRHYYIVALLAKTPLAFLPLLPLGVIQAIRSRRRTLWVPALLMTLLLIAATMHNPYNVGIRHIVPAVPFIILLAAGAAVCALSSKGRGRLIGLSVLALAILGGAETLYRAPHYLSFFNLAAGGPGGGIRILDDSNLDWGQDLTYLAQIQQQQQLNQLALLYFGTADPAAYGVRARRLTANAEFLAPHPGTVYAVSIHYLNRLPLHFGPQADWLQLYQPWKIAGTSIYLYRF